MRNDACVRRTVAIAIALLLFARTESVADPCIEDAFGLDLTCSSNEVTVHSITVLNITEGCSSPTDTMTFDGELNVESNSAERYDIGFYIGTDGTQALNGSCHVSVIPVTAENDLDDDQCGDIVFSGFVQVPVSGVTVACNNDQDSDAFIDVPLCVSWDRMPGNPCTGPQDAVPASNNRCDCVQIDTTQVAVTCGDGALQGAEQCDDGNDSVGDGCDDECFFEICGNGRTQINEECDDGNNSAGDCCTPDCHLVASGTVCRPSAGLCDADDVCNGTSGSCPNDFVPSSTVCRPAAGGCDPAETCTGSSASCPPTGILPSTAICRASAGPCDAAETCNGTSSVCPANGFLVPATRCRASTGVCDMDEFCTGVSASCPADAFWPQGTECVTDNNACTDDGCSGTGDVCAHVPNTDACDDGLFCNGADVCGGGTCNHGGNPCTGADGDANCSESCNELTNTCLGSDPEASVCDDANACSIGDRCVEGSCTPAQLITTCIDGDGCCPSGCGAESDDDCPACFDRPVVLNDCDLLLKRRDVASDDKAIARCVLDACGASAPYSPPADGVRFSLSDAAGPCFADALAGGECVQKGSNYRCKPAQKTDTGLRIVKLKALSACTYKLTAKVTKSDLTCVNEAQSPWVPSFSSGISCGDVGCPAPSVGRVSCPGSCGDGVLQDGEQCEIADDFACPGRCDTTCTCR